MLGGPDYHEETLDIELAELITDLLSVIQTSYSVPYNEWQKQDENLGLMLALTNNMIGFIDKNLNSFDFANFDFRNLRNLEDSEETKAELEVLRSYEGILQGINAVALDEKCVSMEDLEWSVREDYFEVFVLKLPVDTVVDTYDVVSSGA